MHQIIWSPQGLAELDRLVAFISHENPLAARRIARELLLAADSLSIFPYRGRPSSVSGRRELVSVRPYILVYRVRPDSVVDILRVWHAAQDRT